MSWPNRSLGLALLLFISAAGVASVDDASGDSSKLQQDRMPAARVHVCQDVLTSDDVLTDGDGKKAIAIESPTTLIWVDRMPDARFEHPTEYVLISGDGTRVIKGGWWPVLNGKRLFGDDVGTSVKMPISLARPTRHGEP